MFEDEWKCVFQSKKFFHVPELVKKEMLNKLDKICEANCLRIFFIHVSSLNLNFKQKSRFLAMHIFDYLLKRKV